MEGWDPSTKPAWTQIPLLSTRARAAGWGSVDAAAEGGVYWALIAYTNMNKAGDNDWFHIAAANRRAPADTSPASAATNSPSSWTFRSLTPPLPPRSSFLSSTARPTRGGKICLTVHFKSLWAKNCTCDIIAGGRGDGHQYKCLGLGRILSPPFGIAHALCLGLAPWLAAEVPILVDSDTVKHKDDEASFTEY